jgi:hypothetical protein
MAATTQFRTTNWATSSAPDPHQENLPAWGAYLFVRLWTDAPRNLTGGVFGEHTSPAASLAIDLVKASAGIPVQSRGDVLSVGFQSIPSAISAARRLQWAMQGFSESPDLQANSLALLIQAPAEVQGSDIPPILDQVAPGQILLSDKASQLFENLPGLPLQNTGDAQLRELLWRVQDDQATPASDEHFFAELLSMQGLEYHPPEQFASDFPSVEASSSIEEGRPTTEGVAGILELLRSNPRWVMGGVGVLVVLLGALTIPRLFSNKPGSPAVPAAASAENPIATAPASSSPPAASPAAAGSPLKGQGAGQDRNKKTGAVANSKPGPAAEGSPKSKSNVPNVSWVKGNETVPVAPQSVPAAPRQEPAAQRGGHCELDQGEITGALGQAEKNLARGKYDDAIRQFNNVLGCDPNNARARDGIQRAKSAKETEN